MTKNELKKLVREAIREQYYEYQDEQTNDIHELVDACAKSALKTLRERDIPVDEPLYFGLKDALLDLFREEGIGK